MENGAHEVGWGAEMSVTYKNINMPVANGVQEHGKLCHTKAKWRP
jgi:hypothetical protein